MEAIDRIEKALNRIDGQKREVIRKRFVEQLTSPGHGISAKDYASRLFQLLDTLSTAFRSRLLEGVPLGHLSRLATEVEGIANGIVGEASVPEWYEHILTLEEIAFNCRLAHELTPETELAARIAEVQQIITSLNSGERELSSALSLATTFENAATEANTNLSSISEIAQKAAAADSQMDQTTLTLKDKMERADEHLGSIRTVEGNVQSLKGEIATFHASIDEHMQTVKSGQSTIDALCESVSQFLQMATSKRENYEAEVEKLIQLAVGTSLFTAFERRQKQHHIAKWVWGGLALISTAASIVFAVFLADEYTSATSAAANQVPVSFWIKLTTTPLFLFVIGFCTTQYGHSRSLEEAYSFKSALSISLAAYTKLVAEMIADNKEKVHLDFVVETIRQIYSPPEAASRKSKPDPEVASDLMKHILDLVKQLRT